MAWTAWTQSRLYFIADAWPDDRPMPAGAREPLMLRILNNQAFPNIEEAAAAVAAAAWIAQRLTAAKRESENDADH